jgi:hypothetical protein
MLLSVLRSCLPAPRPPHSRRRAGPCPRQRPTARPALEPLEERTVPSGLLSWWTGDDTATDRHGKNDGTLAGGAGYTAGVVNDAFQFNGVDGYLSAPTAKLPTGNHDRTLDLWVKIDAVVTEEAFFAGYGAFGTNNATYHLGASGTTLFFSSWGPALFGPSLATGTWYNVAVTNVGNAVTLYLNGQAVASDNLPIETPSDTQFYMGQIPGDFGDIRRLDGEVDEVRVYGRALDAKNILDIYNHDLNTGKAAASAASQLSAVMSALTTGVASPGPKAPVAVTPDSLALPGHVTSSPAVRPPTPAINAAASGVPAALAGRAASADAVFGNLSGLGVNESLMDLGPASLS